MEKLTDETFIFLSSDIPEFIKKHIPIHSIRKPIKRIGVHKINIHSLRCTYATNLLNNNFNVKAIVDLLTNTVQMIYNVYRHIIKNGKRISFSVQSGTN